jgi:hypothetical protein
METSSFALGVLLAASVASSGCCTEDCDPGVTISFERSTTPGAYVITITADAQTITCNVTLPMPECGLTDCDGDVRLLVSDCGVGSTEQSLGSLWLRRAYPNTVEVAISRDGAEIVRENFAPSYKDTCGCTSAYESITLE